MQIRYEILTQVQFNIEEYVEQALQTLYSKLNDKLKRKTRHLGKQIDYNKDNIQRQKQAI